MSTDLCTAAESGDIGLLRMLIASDSSVSIDQGDYDKRTALRKPTLPTGCAESSIAVGDFCNGKLSRTALQAALAAMRALAAVVQAAQQAEQ